MRRGADPEEQGDPGLLAGLADPRLAAALHALHDDPARSWTVASLAGAAGMSRSAFASHFNGVMGQPPLTYLVRWRMALAKHALRSPRANLADIAAACGYASTGAFSTAFSRTVGVPPSIYAKGG